MASRTVSPTITSLVYKSDSGTIDIVRLEVAGNNYYLGKYKDGDTVPVLSDMVEPALKSGRFVKPSRAKKVVPADEIIS